MRLIILAAAALSLASCASKSAAPVAPAAPAGGSAVAPAPSITGRALYICANGARIDALFEEAANGREARVTLTWEGREELLVLPRQPSATGFRYADADTVFASRGNEVQLNDTRCTDATQSK